MNRYIANKQIQEDLLDIGQKWRKDGAEQIEEMHLDEICPLRSYPSGVGQGRQDQDILSHNNINIINLHFNF
jgi:hypothetical protein